MPPTGRQFCGVYPPFCTSPKSSICRGYLTDLLNKYTGKTTQEHIHLELINPAKSRLWKTDKETPHPRLPPEPRT
ncbi:hypothetical protein [Spirosoma humi]